MTQSSPQGVLALQNIRDTFDAKILVSKTEFLGGKEFYPKAEFSLGKESFSMYIDDENEDLQIGNPLLDLCLVLREIDYYNSTYDYIIWCEERQLDAKNTVILQYYRDLAQINRRVCSILGKIDPCVSDYEFEFNCGTALELRSLSR